jgi:tetratricopeptide (TPR) repeat protein
VKALLILTILVISISLAASEDGNPSRYWTAQGNDLQQQYKFNDSILAYNKALSINQSNIAALAGKGEALWKIGMYNASIQCFDKALNLDKNYVRAWVGKGVALHGLGDLNDSSKAYDVALSIDPNYAMAWNDKAWLLYKQNRYNESINCSDKAIEILNRALAATLDTKGVALEKLGKNYEAMQYINKALELTPLDSIVWIHRGDILKVLGNQTGSDAAYAKAKELPMQALDESSV